MAIVACVLTRSPEGIDGMYRLHTFGGLRIDGGDTPIGGAAAQRSRQALLAAIASAGDSGISRDRLLIIFWPESDTERARAAR